MPLHTPSECQQCDIWEKSIKNLNPTELLREVYLENVKRTVTGYNLMTESNEPNKGDDEQLETIVFFETKRFYGHDWPRFGFTMTGMARLNALHDLLKRVSELIFIETLLNYKRFLIH